MSIKWLHAPGHSRSIGPAVVQRAYATKAHVIDWTEMMFNIGYLRSHTGHYHHFTAEGTRTDARNREVGHDVVISVRNDCEVLHHGQFFVANQGVPLKYRPERHGVWVLFQAPDKTKVLIVCWHPQPGRLPRMLGLYRRETARVRAHLNHLVKKYSPDLVLAGGDLQVGPGPRAIAPNHFAESLGLDSDYHKIDWQFWSQGWRTAKHWLIDPSKINHGMDHVWMVRRLRKK